MNHIVFVDRVTTCTADWLNNVDAIVNASAVEAISTLAPAADTIAYYTGPLTASLATLTSFGRSVIACVDAAALATLLSGFLGGGGGGASLNPSLDCINNLTAAADQISYYTSSSTAAMTGLTAFGRSLIDDVDAGAALTTLGAETSGAAAAALVTAEAYTDAAISGLSFAPLNSPGFTGVPTAPTATGGTNTTQIATCAFVETEVAGVISGAGYAPIASPTFTGTVTAPILALGRVLITPNVTYDLNGAGASGSVLSTNFLVKNSDTFVVPTGKQTDIFSIRADLETQGTGEFIGVHSEPTISTTNTDFNYAIIGDIVVAAGSGKVTAQYSRASAAGGSFAGVLVGHTIGVTGTVNTGFSAALSLDSSGGTVGWGATLTSNDTSDCGWGYYIGPSVVIRNAAFAHNADSTDAYSADFLRHYDKDTNLILSSGHRGRLNLTPVAFDYNLISSTTGASLNIQPGAVTVATGKILYGVLLAPGSLTLSGTATYVGYGVSAASGSSASGTTLTGITSTISNAGSGITYGVFTAASGTGSHSGQIVGHHTQVTMVATSGTTVGHDIILNTNTTAATAQAGSRINGSVAGDQVTNGYSVQSNLNVMGAAFFYNRGDVSYAGDFLKFSDVAGSVDFFRVTKDGDIVLGNITGSAYNQKIIGDFATTTLSYRTVFQTRQTNGNTSVGAIPNGSATTAGFRGYNKSDLTAALNFGTFAQVNTVTVVDANVANAGTQGTMELRIGGTAAVKIDGARNVLLGSISGTSATDGFPYITTCAGIPVGTPTTVSGGLPLCIDSTNQALMMYNGSAWKAIPAFDPYNVGITLGQAMALDLGLAMQ